MKHAFLFGIHIVACVAGISAGTSATETVTVDGDQRSFQLYTPPSVDASKQVPAVIVLHGAMMNGSMVRSMSGMDETAAEKAFIAVYPDGTGTGTFKSWNAGGIVGPMGSKADDVKFISSLIDVLITKHNVDPNRVFLTGISNGGMLCYRLACELGNKIAAIAPVAGTLATSECAPSNPMPIIHFHGTDDNFVPYGGPNKMTPKMFTFKSVDETLAYWREKNLCRTESHTEKLQDTEDDGTSAERILWTPQEGGAPISLVKISGGGHTWPGKNGMQGMIGKSCLDISANQIMWEFFEQNPRHDQTNQ